MVGFTCNVMGKTDPTEFFYGMTLCFDGPPHLVDLKRAIENAVMDDNVVVEGASFIVSDIEILDLRINQWVNLESRAQLYSGCHLAAIRDSLHSTAAGSVEPAPVSLNRNVLGFAMDAQQMFQALDLDRSGDIRVKSMLKVLRHDPDYAIDAFAFLDSNGNGVVTFAEFLAHFNDGQNKLRFEELKFRIQHGGRSAEPDNHPSSRMLDASLGHGEDEISLKSKASLSSIRAYRQQAQSAAETPNPKESGELGATPVSGSSKKVTMAAAAVSPSSQPIVSIADDPAPFDGDPSKIRAAKGVVDILQKSLHKRRERESRTSGSGPSGGGSPLASSKPAVSANVLSKLRNFSKSPGVNPPGGKQSPPAGQKRAPGLSGSVSGTSPR